ncbi:MAG: tetratricopeptide repeat protein [Acidobacteriota bacterium]|nr:tetratricopeptide repeat protein [Acidobacteriota bacterium]
MIGITTRFFRPEAIAALALLTVAGTATAEETRPDTPARGSRYPGAMFLYMMSDVTVVYPAAAGTSVEKNRRSAEQRAEFLRRSHGVEARVRSDAELTDEDKNGNLLVLGWDNALLGTEETPAPFRRSTSGFEFLGIEETDPSADLLFIARSPYDPDRWLVFWSRIDPELDRFLVLPAVGSDWAIYEDALITRQGMFLPGSEWPPRRNTGAEGDQRALIDHVRETWSTRQTDHYMIRYDPEAVSSEELASIVTARAEAYTAALAAIGGLDSPPRIKLYVYKDPESKEQLSGIPDAAHSMPRKGEIHMLPRHARSASPHEEIHVLARAKYGPAYLTAMYEGLAVAESGLYHGAEIDVMTAIMMDTGVLPDVATLLDEERGRLLAEEIRWPASAMFVRWARQTAGDRWPAVYTLAEGTVEELGATLGLSPDTVERAFLTWMAAQAETRETEVRFLDALSDSRERYLAADYQGMVVALSRALEIKPNDLQTIFNIASARMRTGEYDLAAKDLERLLELDQDPTSQFVVFGHYQLGRLFDIQGRREEALVHYRAMLELPDQHDAHHLAREAIETPVTVEQLQ